MYRVELIVERANSFVAPLHTQHWPVISTLLNRVHAEMHD